MNFMSAGKIKKILIKGALFAVLIALALFLSAGESQAAISTAKIDKVTSDKGNGTYGVGEVIDIKVSFEKNGLPNAMVKVTGGTPELTLWTGANQVISYSGAMNGFVTFLKFSYTVQNGDNTNDLDYAATNSLNLNGATITDLAGATVTNLTLPNPGNAKSLSGQKQIAIDTTAPVVTNIYSDFPSEYKFGAYSIIYIRVKFNEPITVSGFPQLALSGISQNAIYYSCGFFPSIPCTVLDVKDFKLTVQPGDNADPLEALSINGGSIKDAAGNMADLTLPAPGAGVAGAGSLSVNKRIVIETAAPLIWEYQSYIPGGGGAICGFVSMNTGCEETACWLKYGIPYWSSDLTINPPCAIGDLRSECYGNWGCGTGMFTPPTVIGQPVTNGTPNSEWCFCKIPGAGGGGDTTSPTVTINQAVGQADPTGISPINFTVVFSEPVSDFATGDVTLSGTAGATIATVTGANTTYNVAVSGMTGSGTVIATLIAGVAHDAAGNASEASTSTDNTVIYDITPPTVTISVFDNTNNSIADGGSVLSVNANPVIFKSNAFDPLPTSGLSASHRIEWTVDNWVNTNKVNCGAFTNCWLRVRGAVPKVEFSTDNGANWTDCNTSLACSTNGAGFTGTGPFTAGQTVKHRSKAADTLGNNGPLVSNEQSFDVLNSPPSVDPATLSLTSPTSAELCAAGAAYRFEWTFSDPDAGDTESQYQIQIDNNSNFTSPTADMIFSGLSNPNGTVNNYSRVIGINPDAACTPTPCANSLAYDTIYYWRVQVWDSAGDSSGWVVYDSDGDGFNAADPDDYFKTKAHMYPTANFTFTFADADGNIAVDEDITFTDDCIANPANCSVAYGGSTITDWDWDLCDGDVSCPPGNRSPSGTPVTKKYNTAGTYTIKLTVKDSTPAAQGGPFECSATKPVNVGAVAATPAPKWKEVIPK